MAEQSHPGPRSTSSHRWVNCWEKSLAAATPASPWPSFREALWRPWHSPSLFTLNQLGKHRRPKTQHPRLWGFVPEFASGLAPGACWSSLNKGRARVDRTSRKCSPGLRVSDTGSGRVPSILQMYCVRKDLSVSETLKASRYLLFLLTSTVESGVL